MDSQKFFRKLSKRELEKNIGCWVHIGTIFPQVHYFLSRLRDLQSWAKNRRSIKLPENCVCLILDLGLWSPLGLVETLLPCALPLTVGQCQRLLTAVESLMIVLLRFSSKLKISMLHTLVLLKKKLSSVISGGISRNFSSSPICVQGSLMNLSPSTT